MINLSEISIRRPVFAWMLMAALIIFGGLSFKRLGVSQLPDVDFPVVGVSVTLAGAAPQVMEMQVIDPIEDVLMQIGGIRNITSSASQSSASISIEFELDRNIDEAMQEVQDRIAQVSDLLPENLSPPTVRKRNPEDQPIMWIAVSHDETVSNSDMMIFARNVLFNQFATIKGVGDISLGGYVDFALRVWIDLKKLDKYNLTVADVLAAIQSEHVEIPAGRIENDEEEFNIRIMGEAKTGEEFGHIPISVRAGGVSFRPIELKDVARIEEGTIDVRRISRFNGRPAVGLGILKQHGSNAVEVARAVRAKLEKIRPDLPKAYDLSIRSDNTRFIQESVDHLNFMLLLSALLTSIVCFLFLGSWTSTINILMAIPTSIIGTFIVIYFFGFTLNTFTLLGLSLAIGIVVDDAIMMLENIVRHREIGESRKTAALRGAKEITFAAVAATVAIVAIFLPVIFMKGVIGRYFFQYGITVSAAVLLSLLEALTLTPMRCSQYLNIHTSTKGFAARIDHIFHKLSQGYGHVLHFLLRHRLKTLVLSILLFIASLFVAFKLPSEMMPAQDQSMFLVRLKGPVGSSLQATDEAFKSAEDTLRKHAEIDGVFSLVGGFGGDAVNQGIMFVTLVEPKKRKISQAELMKTARRELEKQLSSMKVVTQDLSLRGFAASRGFPVEFTVQGPNWGKLNEQTNALMESLKASAKLTDINTDIQAGMPELRILPNREKLAKHGVSLSTVTSVVNALIGGAVLNGLTEFTKDNRRYPIEVRLEAEQRKRSEQIKKIKVRNNRGENVALSDLVDLEEGDGLMLITRLNRARSIAVYANTTAGFSQQNALKLVQEHAQKTLEPGYNIVLSGSAQSFRESFQSLLFAMLLGLIVSYMVLASQFNSFLHPISVLMALPFSFSGAFIALAISHQSLNIFSLIGFILLMGIVKKNSILLVDYTNQMRQVGLPVNEALLHACPVRLRPILMTSIAMIVGSLPEALSVGPGAETAAPMAIAIIGGLLASTVLTLFVVPCAYSVIARFERPDHLDPDSVRGSGKIKYL